MVAESGASKKRSSRDHFDRWADEYERDRVSRWLAELQQEALGALALGPDDRLLDVGCGTGAAVRTAAASVAEAVGVDLSAGMIERGRELAAGLANVRLVIADAEALPFEDGTFSALLCTTSFHHYPAPQLAAAEMARVLAPKGRIVVADMITDRMIMWIVDRALRRTQRSHVGCRRSVELERILVDAGFHAPVTRCLFHGFHGIVTARKPA